MTTFKKLFAGFAVLAVLATASVGAHAEPKKEFKLAWSIYVGWMPWGWAADLVPQPGTAVIVGSGLLLDDPVKPPCYGPLACRVSGTGGLILSS